MSRIRVFHIIIIFFTLAQMLAAQEKAIFLPYPNVGDSTYYYEISNTDVLRFKMFERPPVWYMDEAVSPCYLNNVTTEKGDQMIWQRGKEEYVFDNTQYQKKFIKAKIKDPFTNRWSNLTFEEDIKVYNDASGLENYQTFDVEGSYVFNMLEADEDIQNFLSGTGATQLRIRTMHKFRYVRENPVKMVLPFEQISSQNVHIAIAYTPFAFEIYSDGAWSALEGKPKKDIMQVFQKVEKSWFQFMDNGTKREVGVIETNPDNEQELLSSYFIYPNAYSKLRKCNLDGGGIYLFPNPSFGQFNVRMYGFPKGHYKLEIYNIIGKAIHSLPFELTGDENVNFNLPNMSKGTYIYSILNSAGNNLETKRLMIMGL